MSAGRQGSELPVVQPHWPVAQGVHVFCTTRLGGVSQAPYDSLNLGLHVDDDENDVRRNRELLTQLLALPAEPHWLRQVHGCEVLDVDSHHLSQLAKKMVAPTADAACVSRSLEVIAIMTADCLPVVLATGKTARAAGAPLVVAAAHAGWRGLAAGVLQQTVAAMPAAPADLCAWLGPAIGPSAFEVGDEVREAFLDTAGGSARAMRESAFVSTGEPGKWFADLYLLARCILGDAGITEVSGGEHCTFLESDRFFSHRRDGAASGRMVTLAWLE